MNASELAYFLHSHFRTTTRTQNMIPVDPYEQAGWLPAPLPPQPLLPELPSEGEPDHDNAL